MAVVAMAAVVAAPPRSAAEKFTLRNMSRPTGGFAEEKKIGSGSFGSVYSAKLPDGREFAIKRAERGANGGHLHGDATNGSLLFASWEARLQVALDAARGMEYLHCYAVPAIIHHDVKPSNILLDDDWTVKVSNFSLSLASGGAVAAAIASSSITAGTIGYIDPEYYQL
ncbi:putative serine/threonine-protein kinase-like protein CCR3 [Setaria viridis]|uniref:putative serine/threonine-protein kinase-like protein CCR3 n=1 Tax=Setaria viridis TaxID=4556 RepID=UPI003B3A52CD